MFNARNRGALWIMMGAFVFGVSARRAVASVIDIIPNSQSGESDQNSSPSLAVDPLNPLNMVATGFGNLAASSPSPFFASSNGGSAWTQFQTIQSSDSTLGWGSAGAYESNLAGNSTSGYTLAVRDSVNPNTTAFTDNPTGDFSDPTGPPDQPSLTVNSVSGQDHVYIAFNDLGAGTPNTAAVRISTNSGSTWNNVYVDRSGTLQDANSVRVAANGSHAYAAFLRFTQNNGTDFLGSVVVERDDNSGADLFKDQQTTVASSVITGTKSSGSSAFLGQENIGNLSLAVDPNNSNRVVIAYLDGTDASPTITVQESTDGGVTWAKKFQTTVPSALGEVSITSDGSVGLLYNELDASNNWEVHFVETGNDFGATTNNTLAQFPDNNPAKQFNPYLGDFESVKSVGNNFYGVFSASNNDTNPTFSFPEGVTFQRDMSAGLPVTSTGASVPVSIDPFLFQFGGLTSTPEPGLFSLESAGLIAIMALNGRRRRRK